MKYHNLLRQYLETRDAKDLDEAESFANDIIAQGWGLRYLASVHWQEIQDMMERRAPDGCCAAAHEFFVRALVPFQRALNLAEQNEQLLQESDREAEDEAQRIAHSLHDDAGHMLVFLHNAVEEMDAKLAPADKPLSERAFRTLNELDEYLRTLSHELRPTALDDLGLVPALRCLAEGIARRRRISVRVSGATRGRLPRDTETAAYRICQEALSNSGRHSAASQIHIKVAHDSGMLTCSVEDNGLGFDIARESRASVSHGIGLSSMRKRAAAVGGRLQIRSAPGGGTRVEFHAPITEESSHPRRTPPSQAHGPLDRQVHLNRSAALPDKVRAREPQSPEKKFSVAAGASLAD